MKNITAEEGTIRAQIIKDANEAEEAKGYIKEVVEHGCIGGNCVDLVYTKDTHAFYAKHADEIDDILERIEEESDTDPGEAICEITEYMQRAGHSDLRNFLAWLAYEVEAEEIMIEINES